MVFRYSSLEGVDKPLNNFKNDGSFLETFKKLQSASSSSSSSPSSSSDVKGVQANKSPRLDDAGPSSTSPRPSETPATSSSAPKPKPAPPIIGKRRGGRILPTGRVKKSKNEEETEESPKDAWSLYLREVKKYRETTCQEDDSKTRPLVK